MDAAGQITAFFPLEKQPMATPNLDRSVEMICQTCAGTQFLHDPENFETPIQCAGCNRVYTREELLAENGERLEIELDEMKKEMADYARKRFREAFRGLKHFKVK